MTRVILILLGLPLLGFSATPSQVEFFESKVRPILFSRCGTCHSDKVKMKGIELTSREGVHLAQEYIAAGTPDSSRLLQAVRYEGTVKMPPSSRLSDGEIESLTRWVKEGAFWPETAATVNPPQANSYWAFRPVVKPAAPSLKNTSWARSDIDRFILAKLEQKGIKPVQDANKYELLRRVTLDLTGLLPEPDDVAAFLADRSPQAFECVVDRLLASPAFGDRWGRHWLDVTYYADTTGVGRRIPLPEAWRYRDYVIQSFNEDKPYDRFVKEQIAGVEDPAKPEFAATGFLVLGPWAWFSYDRKQLRLDVSDLQTDLVGRTFLGLTVGCARCHDHKFDPITNKDYYGMAGIFLSTKTLAPGNAEGGINTVRVPENIETVRRYAGDYESWQRRVAETEAAEKVNQEEQAAVQQRITGVEAATPLDETLIQEAEAQLAALKKKSGTAPDRQIVPFTKYMKPALPYVYAAEDMDFPEDARIAVKGDAHALGDFTPRRFLSAVSFGAPPEIAAHSSGRKELADWIASEKNPLTARVYVNRIWHHLFGDGIVATTENFGSRGEPPTHPELLDYLASRLIENGWSTKKTIQDIVLSRVYQLSSKQDEKSSEIDPDNKLLWRANRRRLEVEAIRDSVLQVSGHLDAGRGGPALPLTAQNVHTIAPFFLEDDSVIEDSVRFRRTVYQPIMRNSQMEDVDILNLFDFKDPDQVVGTRMPTTVPTQTLYLMNAPFVKQEARRLAASLLEQKNLDDNARVSRIIFSALNRPATDRDFQQAKQFLSDFEGDLRKEPKPPSDTRLEAWTRYCHAIFASSEFLYRR